MIQRRALSAGVKILRDMLVVSVSPGFSESDGESSSHGQSSSYSRDEKPSVTLHGGETLYADIIVGADGARGATRECVAGPSEPKWTGEIRLSGSIPRNELDPTLLEDLIVKDSGVWFGDGECGIRGCPPYSY